MKQGKEKNDFGAWLAHGTLPTTTGTLYTCPADFRVIVQFFRIFNAEGAGSESVTLYAKHTTRTVIYRAPTLAADTHDDVIEPGQVLTLLPGDLLEGVTATADTVSYYITGRLEPV